MAPRSASGPAGVVDASMPAPEESLKRQRASRRRGSSFAGALNPRHTTKISADAARDAAGLVASTLSKSCLKA